MISTAATLNPAHVPRSRMRWMRRLLSLILLGLAVHLLAPQISGFSSTWQTMRHLRWCFVGLALLLQVGSYFGSGILLRGLVRLGGGRLRITQGMEITLASDAVGLVAAGIIGSSAATYSWIHDDEGDGEGAGLAATLKPVFNNALLLVIAVYASIHLLVLGDLSITEAVGFAIILAIILAVVSGLAWGATHPAHLHRLLCSARRRLATLHRRDHSADQAAIEEQSQHDVEKLQNAWMLVRTGGWKQPLLGAVMNIVCDAASLAVLFIAAGDRIGIAALLTGYSVALLLGKAAFFLPGGVGVVEATMLAIFVTLGAAHPAAIVAVLAYRLLSFWIPAMFGLPLAAYLQRSTAR